MFVQFEFVFQAIILVSRQAKGDNYEGELYSKIPNFQKEMNILDL